MRHSSWACLHILVHSGSGGSTTATGPIESVVDEDLVEDFNVKYVGALRSARAIIPFLMRGYAICRMVDAADVAFVAVFLASEKAWVVSGELVAASGGAGRSAYY